MLKYMILAGKYVIVPVGRDRLARILGFNRLYRIFL